MAEMLSYITATLTAITTWLSTPPMLYLVGLILLAIIFDIFLKFIPKIN